MAAMLNQVPYFTISCPIKYIFLTELLFYIEVAEFLDFSRKSWMCCIAIIFRISRIHRKPMIWPPRRWPPQKLMSWPLEFCFFPPPFRLDFCRNSSLLPFPIFSTPPSLLSSFSSSPRTSGGDDYIHSFPLLSATKGYPSFAQGGRLHTNFL